MGTNWGDHYNSLTFIDPAWLRETINENLTGDKYSSLLNRRVARNKDSGGKDEPFWISVVPGISMMVRIFTPVAVIKRRTKWIKVSN